MTRHKSFQTVIPDTGRMHVADTSHREAHALRYSGHIDLSDRMSKNTYPLKLPTSVKKAAAELAASDGVSLNQFIAAAVAEKVGTLRAADDFLRERAGSAKPKDMLKYLRRAPKVAPDADDMPVLSK
jgi:hypothetical protein